jgi:hypothetical protein
MRGKIHFSQRFRLFPEFYAGRDYQEPIIGLRVQLMEGSWD